MICQVFLFVIFKKYYFFFKNYIILLSIYINLNIYIFYIISLISLKISFIFNINDFYRCDWLVTWYIHYNIILLDYPI